MEKMLSSIYLDPSQPASFGGLDAVYRAVKHKGKVKFLASKFKIGRVNKTFTPSINLPTDTTRQVESLFLVLTNNFKQIW